MVSLGLVNAINSEGLKNPAKDIIFGVTWYGFLRDHGDYEDVLNRFINERLLQKDRNNFEHTLFMRDILVPFKVHCKTSSQFVKDVLVPVRNNQIATEVFPFVPKLQEVWFDEGVDIKESCNYVLAPEGVGKTALISRKLGANPGIMMTCSPDSQNLSDSNGDAISIQLLRMFKEKPIIDINATASQLILCNFIARLLFLHFSLTIWEQTENKTPFDNPLQMLSYAQYNRNTMKVSSEIFSEIVKSNPWISAQPYYISNFLNFLMRKLYDRLNLRNDSPFIIAIDNASLFLQFQTPILSNKGTPRNLFSLMEKEIFHLKSSFPIICDIYCGTYFKIERIEFVKSTLGRLREMTPPYNFIGLNFIDFEQALQLLQTMYDVDALLEASNISKTEFYQSVKHIFPTRRRVIGLVASFLETTSSPDLVQIFKDQWNNFVKSIETSVLERIDNKQSPEYLDPSFLMDVFLINEYDIGGKTITCDDQLASSVIGSGIAKPNLELFEFNVYTYCNEYQFDASDPILQKVAKEIVTKKYLNSMTIPNNPISILNQLLTIPHDNPQVWNKIFPLLLQHHCGKSLKNNAVIANLITKGSPYEPLMELNFEIKSFIQSINFYYKYRTSKWAQALLNRSVKKFAQGDVFYFHCLLNYNKPIEENSSTTFKDIIDGLYFYPSTYCHADGICLNFSDDGPYGVIVSNKLHNFDTRREFLIAVKKGIKCTKVEEFYINYDLFNSFFCGCDWGKEKQDFITTLSKNNRLIPLLAHLHIKYQHIKTTKGERIIKGFSEGGKYLIMNPDPNSIRELCPDIFYLFQRNLFNTAKIQ